MIRKPFYSDLTSIYLFDFIKLDPIILLWNYEIKPFLLVYFLFARCANLHLNLKQNRMWHGVRLEDFFVIGFLEKNQSFHEEWKLIPEEKSHFSPEENRKPQRSLLMVMHARKSHRISDGYVLHLSIFFQGKPSFGDENFHVILCHIFRKYSVNSDQNATLTY